MTYARAVLKKYGQIRDPEHFDLLIRLIPRRHVEVRALINEYKYENKRLLHWYERIPKLMDALKEQEKTIALLRNNDKLLRRRLLKIINGK